MKKRYLILVLLVLLAAALPLAASAETKSGTCGDNLTWTLTDSGVLTISGSGEMDQYDAEDHPAPWKGSVREAQIGSGVTSIGQMAFNGCSVLESVTIPKTVASIGSSAFMGCSSLREATIPSGVRMIDRLTFYECSSLTSVTIPNTVESIGLAAFQSCASMKSVTIPNGVVSIGMTVFYECTGLTDITIPESVQSIGWGAFIRCANLKNITIPRSVVQIGEEAFNQCSNDLTISCYAGSYAQVYAEAKNMKVKLLDASAKPTITTQPKSATVSAGKTATFKVVATDATGYQWYYRNSASDSWKKSTSASATKATYTFTAKATHTGHQYRCQVKNAAGSVYSSTVTLTVAAKPAITTQPKSVTVNEGKTATFKVKATDASTYRWYYRKSATSKWAKVAKNSAAATLSFTAKANQKGWQFRCLLKNSVGSVYSNTVTLTVNLLPAITAQPRDAAVTAGKTATFTVKASGADSYQWYYRKSASGKWQKVAENSAAATLKVTTNAKLNGWQYRCLLKNSVGSVYTNTVTVTVE